MLFRSLKYVKNRPVLLKILLLDFYKDYGLDVEA